MAADFLIDPSQSPAGNRYQSFAAYVTANGTNINAANRGRYTTFEIVTNLTENVDFGSWTTTATNGIEIYGTTPSIIWRITGSGSFGTACATGSAYLTLRDIKMRGGTSGLGWPVHTGSNAKLYRVVAYEGELGYRIDGDTLFEFCTAYSCTAYSDSAGFLIRQFTSPTIINCRSFKNSRGFDQANSGNSITIWNSVAYGNTTNWNGWSSTTAGTTSARNNAGVSGDTIPQTVSSTTITGLVNGDFVDWTNNDFHITSTSRLRHTHASYPTGDNSRSGTHYDIDNQLLPTYSTDADRWDTGADYYVLVVVGTRYYRATDLAAAANGSAVYRASDDAAYTLDDLVAEDTLEIRSGAVVHFKDNGSVAYNYLKGVKFDIVNGELWIENALTAAGMTLFGILGGKITVGALGKLYARGALIELANLSLSAYASNRALDQNEWDNVFGTGTKDTTAGGKYGEPSVLFVGTSAGTAVPWFNKGSGTTIGDVANDTTHGRFFTFAPTTGVIDWPDQVPATTERVYCWNLMLHSQNGQGTPAASYGIDVTAGGAVDMEKIYFTGNPNFENGNGLRLSGFGVLQPCVIKHCSGLTLDIHQSLSQANEQLGALTLDTCNDEAAAGKLYAVGSGSAVVLKNLKNSKLASVFAYGIGSQSSGSYRISIQGTDKCEFDTVTAIDGGVSFDTSISVSPVINSLNLSNDQATSNANNQQHGLFVASTGVRGLRVNAINLLASGRQTPLDLINLNNAGDVRVTAITYAGTVRNLAFVEGCFDVLVSGAVITGTTQQVLGSTIGSNNRDIQIQNVRFTATVSSPPSFLPYNAEKVTLKNVAFEASSRYSSWAAAVPDLNFLEMNSGGGSTGILAVMFARNTQGLFTLTGTAKSNNADAVTLPAVSDRVEIEWPYDILVGSASPYFRNVAPTVTGTNTGNLTVEYSINNNGAGYGSWKTLNATNLNGETLSTRFRIRFRVTCATAGATNAIKQLTLETNIDATVAYPAVLVPIKLRNMVSGSTYAVYRGTVSSANQIALGTAPGGDVTLSGIAYTSDEQINVRVRRSGTSFDPDYLEFNQTATLTENGADIFVSQVEDLVAS